MFSNFKVKCILNQYFHLVTVRNVVAARLCFHRCLLFYSRGGVHPSMHWDRHPPCRPPPGRPPGRLPPEQTPPAQCILGYTPPHTHTGGYCSGRYASYWNAFLFKEVCILLRPLVDFFQLGFNNTSLLIISTVYAS